MMKGFVKKGLVLLALGVLIAGCASPSQENSISSRNNGTEGIPMVLDPGNHSLTIGDGAGGFTLTKAIYGHTVDILNGTTAGGGCQSDGGINSKCWIRLWNRDSTMYMANTFVTITKCDLCDATGRLVDNFDTTAMDGATCWDAAGNPKVINGCTLHVPTVAGGPSPLQTARPGVAYVADTSFPEIGQWPSNPFGAPLTDIGGQKNVKPAWMIAPVCGTQMVAWDFGGGADVSPFPFLAKVQASWFQYNPMGANNVRGGGDDDPRYNFNYYNTVYLTLTDLVSRTTDSDWKKVYRPGSVYRSNVLAGYKPTGATGVSGVSMANIPYATQKYFGVNVGIESPDRMENMNFGLKSDPNFEYYQSVNVEVSWNPKVLTHLAYNLASWNLTKAGGTRIQSSARMLCNTPAVCADFLGDHAMDMTFDINTDVAYGGGAIDRGGYIGVASTNLVFVAGSPVSGWSYFGTGEFYNYMDFGSGATVNVGPAPDSQTIPKKFFQRGYARIRCMTANDATCIQQDGADADPEFWLATFVLKVLPTGQGLSSEIKVDTHSGFTSFIYKRAAGTFDTSGGAVLPFTNAGPYQPDDNVEFNVYDGATTVIGGGNNELLNGKIRHRGPVKTGTAQAWNVGVCIQ